MVSCHLLMLQVQPWQEHLHQSEVLLLVGQEVHRIRSQPLHPPQHKPCVGNQHHT